MKIENITVQNFKAVSHQSIDFNGCSAIITAGNNKGKTSVLRGLIDRFRGEKLDIIVKEGEERGFNIMELSDGCKIEWKFTEKTESFAYTTTDGFRMTQGVLSAIGQKYFGIKFDIDKFLSSGPAAQTRELQKIVGLDFGDIDMRYKESYDERTGANKVFSEVSGKKLQEPEKVEKPELEVLKKEHERINHENETLEEKWRIDNQKHREDTISFNTTQTELRENYNKLSERLTFIQENIPIMFADCFDNEKAKRALNSRKVWKDTKPIEDLEEPTYLPWQQIEIDIDAATEQQRLFDSYERNKKYYDDWVAEGKKARDIQVKADEKVKSIQAEKNKMIAGAKIPDEFKITETGITYNGLPLTDSQISSSSKYIAALKLGAMVLGKLRTMHFDASFLDKNSLAEIQLWANENDLQLLIERPDFDGGDIQYKIIES